MKTVLAFLCIVGVTQAVDFGHMFGICAEMCGSGCQPGYTCQSNGCGHSCMPDRNTLLHLDLIKNVAHAKRQLFGTCVEMCSLTVTGSCPSGYECRSNGCGHTCHKISSISKLNLKCRPVLCELYCAGGFATNSDGCPVCSCKSFSSLKDILKQAIV